MSKRIILLLTTLLVGAFSQADDNTLTVYNWTDYMPATVLADFQSETGIQVNYHTFESNEELLELLADPGFEADLIGPSAEFLPSLIATGQLQPLNPAQLQGRNALNPELMKRLESYDPENRHALPYLWGTVGIGYNVNALRARGVSPDQLATWGAFFDPDFMAAFADCGINLLASPEDVFDISLKYLGLDPTSESRADQYKVANLLARIRPLVSSFDASDYINSLAQGSVCITLAWSGDLALAKARAAELGNNIELAYLVPTEGTSLWMDTLAIPSRARQPGHAHRFLSFLLRPDVMARISNYARYANANDQATAAVDADLRNDPQIYLNASSLSKTWPSSVASDQTQALRQKLWARLVERQ